MLLGRRQISPGDTRRYAIDYSSWLNEVEELSAMAFDVDTGPATVDSYEVSSDGKSVVFYVTGAVLTTTPFNVTVQADTSLNQTRNDHVEFNVLAA